AMRSSWLYFAVRARGAAGLDLPHPGPHGQVGDEGVLRLAGAVRDHGAVSVGAGVRDALQRLGERADLIPLDEDRVRHALLDPAIQPFAVWSVEIVSPTVPPGGQRFWSV